MTTKPEDQPEDQPRTIEHKIVPIGELAGMDLGNEDALVVIPFDPRASDEMLDKAVAALTASEKSWGASMQVEFAYMTESTDSPKMPWTDIAYSKRVIDFVRIFSHHNFPASRFTENCCRGIAMCVGALLKANVERIKARLGNLGGTVFAEMEEGEESASSASPVSAGDFREFDLPASTPPTSRAVN